MDIRRPRYRQCLYELCCFFKQQQEETLERMEHAREEDCEHNDECRESNCLRHGSLAARRLASLGSLDSLLAMFWPSSCGKILSCESRSLLQEEGGFRFLAHYSKEKCSCQVFEDRKILEFFNV